MRVPEAAILAEELQILFTFKTNGVKLWESINAYYYTSYLITTEKNCQGIETVYDRMIWGHDEAGSLIDYEVQMGSSSCLL